MFERISGVWFGLAVLLVWSLVCALLAFDVWDPTEAAQDRGEAIAQLISLALVFVLWLLVIVPTAWGLRRSRLG